MYFRILIIYVKTLKNRIKCYVKLLHYTGIQKQMNTAFKNKTRVINGIIKHIAMNRELFVTA